MVLNVLFIIHPGITGLTTLWGYSQTAQATAVPLRVNVTAKQWEWDFAYPKYHVKDVDKLVVPVNKPVQFVLKSEDVVHSFWVPAWGIKRAVIPSETRTLVVTPDTVTSTKVGPTVRVQCAQICGVGHAFMLADLRVVSASDFKQWIAGQNMYRRWFWLFILAEAMIFVTLFSTRFLLAFASKPSSLNIATTPKLIRRIERSRSRSSAKSISRPLGATQVGY